MKNFAYVKTHSLNDALSSLGSEWNEAAVMAGGTDLLGQMKDYIYSPDKVVNVKTISDMQNIDSANGGFHIGAAVTLKKIVENTAIRQTLPALAESASLVASPQIRNMGTIGGNICQRPRCWYFRDAEVPCLKKDGDRCFALTGKNKYHAILGGNPCYIVHPSDTAVALIAYDAVFTVQNNNGSKEVPAADFFVLPEVDPLRENVLEPGDVLTMITVPVPENGSRSTFIKVQEREAWDFAVASVAVNLTVHNGRCSRARIVLGAAAPIPWRSEQAEKELEGKAISESTAAAAAEAALQGRRTFRDNAYKVDMFKNIVKRAILDSV